MASNNLEDYFRNSKSIDHALRATITNQGVAFYIHPQGVDGETMDFAVERNNIFQLKNGMKDHQYQVIEGCIGAEQMQCFGYTSVKLEDAVIDIKISTKVRQIGATSLVGIIEQALIAAGYANVHIDSRDMDVLDKHGGRKHLFSGDPEKNDGNGKNIRINVIDTHPKLKKG